MFTSLRRTLLLAQLAVAVFAATAPSATAAQPLRTGIHISNDPAEASTAAFQRIRESGASVVRLAMSWREIAPVERAVGFSAADPAEPSYRWERLDQLVRLARAQRVEPLVFFVEAPAWAERRPSNDGLPGNGDPDPIEFGRFSAAAAARYSGTFGGLPRVRYWEAWNEPNLSLYMTPQLENNIPVSPAWYREILQQFATAVRAARRDNVIVAGGLAPFRDISGEVMAQRKDWGPLSFMREFLCLSRQLRPTCSVRLPFDVWAHHPYTSGGPTHHAVLRDDVSLGDLPEMRRVLDAAVRAGHIAARGGKPEFWVTEFSWDSRPPDPRGVPMALLTRWVAEGMYRMWRNGVSLVTWFTLRDQPLNISFFQSGLYFRGTTFALDRPKPALRAFRFPVVGIRQSRGFLIWGRTPTSTAVRVSVQQTFRGGWRELAVLHPDRYGIFQRRFTSAATGSIRARVLGRPDVSPVFGLKPVADRFFNPFGQQTLLEGPPR